MKKLKSLLTGYVVMGTIAPYALRANGLEDSGWLLCDGSVIDPKYRALIAALKSKNTPNLQGLILIGAGSSYKLGDTGGGETHTLATNEIPAHTHNYTSKDTEGPCGNLAEGTDYGAVLLSSTTFNQGGGKAHNNMQPYQVVHYIIYTGQDN